LITPFNRDILRRMGDSQWTKERQAYEALGRLMDDAQAVRNLFESAGLSLPEPLARLFGEATDGVNGRSLSLPTLSVRIPRPESVPPEAREDWIWIPLKDVSPTALLLAVLRRQADVVSSKAVIKELSAFRKGLNPGSIFNIAARLPGVIERSDNGWKLKDPSFAPILHEDHVWGPASVFGKYELAAHRRLLIRHILAANQSGLQIMQIASQLTQCGQCHAPVTKELVKADVDSMQKEGRVRHRGNSKKWELIQQPETRATN